MGNLRPHGEVHLNFLDGSSLLALSGNVLTQVPRGMPPRQFLNQVKLTIEIKHDNVKQYETEETTTNGQVEISGVLDKLVSVTWCDEIRVGGR